MDKKNDIRIINWIEMLQSKGVYAFSAESLEEDLPDYSDIAIKRGLSRLSEKQKILSIYKGYYLIIPPQYSDKGVLPPALFLDTLMQYIQRPYYVALLNAAAYHGASHQQPQEFFVVTTFPVLRPTNKKGLKVNYISIREVPEKLLEQKKTEAGYIKISNPALTATDLIQFEKRIGGLNRAATVLNELVEIVKPEDLTIDLIEHVPLTALQRLGFILQYPCNNELLSNQLFDALRENEKVLFRIPLKGSAPTKGFSSDNRWKVVVNTQIEIDE